MRMTLRSGREFTKPRLLLALGLAGVLLAGCGSGSTANSNGSSGSDAARAAKTEQTALFRGEGYTPPSATSPPPAQHKNVWIMSCDQAIASCSTPTDAAAEAAKLMGWQVTLFDAKFDPARLADGYRQAIAAKADGILVYSLDCALAKSALAAAVQAGIKVVAGESLDCDPSSFTHIVSYEQGFRFPDWAGAVAKAAATNLIAGTNGEPKVIVLDETDIPALLPTMDGFKSRMNQCGQSCQIVDNIQYTAAAPGPALQQKVQQSLLQHPDANAVFLPYDMYSLGPGGAIRASGRHNILVSIGEGQASTMDTLRAGQVNGIGIGIPQGWEGYAEVDALNRLFNGQQPQPSGIGIQSFDATHNVSAAGPWVPPIDYKAAYLKAWGVHA